MPAINTQQSYQGALGNLAASLKSNQGSDQSQMMQAQGQLAQNQGRVQQGLINSGLGNTTVAQTMQQAPLQTYNQNIASIQNNMQHQNMAAYGQLAGMQGQATNENNNLQLALQQQQMQQAANQAKYKASTPGMSASSTVGTGGMGFQG